jgi:hypothetical protein
MEKRSAPTVKSGFRYYGTRIAGSSGPRQDASAWCARSACWNSRMARVRQFYRSRRAGGVNRFQCRWQVVAQVSKPAVSQSFQPAGAATLGTRLNLNAADFEAGDTAGLETCATFPVSATLPPPSVELRRRRRSHLDVINAKMTPVTSPRCSRHAPSLHLREPDIPG